VVYKGGVDAIRMADLESFEVGFERVTKEDGGRVRRVQGRVQEF
jgi:hypothetical protein